MTENQKLREALRFTKKPVTIEAVQFTEALRDAILFDGEPCPAGVKRGATTLHLPTRKVWRAEFFIPTLEGAMNVSVGDWIIKGVKGEYYPCKPDIFAATYDPEALALPTADHRIRIPTDAMEQAFQSHYRRGFEAGKRAALPIADHAPDAGGMINGLTKAETDASASVSGLTAAPVGERERFEKWAREQFYSGLACPSDSWSDERKTYNDPAHHMAFCAFRSALSAGDAVDAQRYRWLMDNCTLGIKQNGVGWSLNTSACVAPDCIKDVGDAIDAAMRKAIP